MIIDVHAHIGVSWLAWSDRFMNVDEMIKLWDKYHVDKACVNSWSINYDPVGGNKEVFEAVKRYPDRLIGFAVVSPRHGRKAVEKEIDRCINDYAMKGLKLHPKGNEFHADSKIVDPAIEKAIQYDIPVLFHSDAGEYAHPSRLGNLARRFPEAKLIMGHMGEEAWLEGIYVAKEHKNIYLDNTGSPPLWLVIQTAIQECSDERIVWGSDSPIYNIAAELAKVTHAQIPEESKEKILSGNIRRLLKI